jgi:hypothetical protein
MLIDRNARFVLGKVVNDIYKKFLLTTGSQPNPTLSEEAISDPTPSNPNDPTITDVDPTTNTNNNTNSKSIYSNYPDLFRYEADQDDRQWLNEKSIIKRKNIKCFLIQLDQVEELFNKELFGDFLNSDGTNRADLGLSRKSISERLKHSSFTLPDAILYKLNRKFVFRNAIN